MPLGGQQLFEDKNLSEPVGQACSSCHEVNHAFTGNGGSLIAAIAQGSTPDKLGTRNVPTLKYMAFSPPFSFVAKKNEKGEMEFTPTGGQFWDGRSDSLADQVQGPLLNKLEMNNADATGIAAKISKSAYAAQFETQFGSLTNQDAAKILSNAATAIAAFESSSRFQPFSSKFDAV